MKTACRTIPLSEHIRPRIGDVVHGARCEAGDWLVYSGEEIPAESVGLGYHLVKIGSGRARGRTAFLPIAKLWMFHLK